MLGLCRELGVEQQHRSVGLLDCFIHPGHWRGTECSSFHGTAVTVVTHCLDTDNGCIRGDNYVAVEVTEVLLV